MPDHHTDRRVLGKPLGRSKYGKIPRSSTILFGLLELRGNEAGRAISNSGLCLVAKGRGCGDDHGLLEHLSISKGAAKGGF